MLLHKPETLVSDRWVAIRSPSIRKTTTRPPPAPSSRDDLVSPPWWDARGKLMGRLTVAEVVDLVYESDTDLRRMGDQR